MASPEAGIIKFFNVGCDECDELPIIGTRWKCEVCDDYDLCTTCYMSEKHSPEHSFVSFDAPGRPGIKVAARQGSGSGQGRDKGLKFRGIFCDACRHRDIVGTRWKCAVCFNYDLCTTCYQGGKHNLDHAFLCINMPGGTAIKVPPRREARAEAVTFLGINCDGCDQCDIPGTRWKCALCVDYDLCTACYEAGKHNLDHAFLRVDVPGGTAEMVASRRQSGSVPVESVPDNDVTFQSITCDGCDKQGIPGALWTCDQCSDYNLCTSCYMANAHNLDHVFWRIDSPYSRRLKISPRQNSIAADDRQAQQASRFFGVNCDGCGERGIAETRWKCAFCFDYDLCTACYEGGKHNLDHTFLRVDVPNGTAAKVPPRKGYARVPVEALADGGIIFPGINCDICGKRGIVGPRWKCAVCTDCDLCTACYMANRHNFDHVFLRFDSPGRKKGLNVSPRQEPLRAEDRDDRDEVVLFHGVCCDSCNKPDVGGVLWKCDSCSNYNLCTSCYMAGAHNLYHGFLRFDMPFQKGNKVLPRINSALFGDVLDDSETARGEQRAVKFEGVRCDGCDQRGIIGTRWKCAICFDYDLCSTCYRGDEHDFDHGFLRFDQPGAGGVHVLPRENSRNACTGATSVDELPTKSPDEDHGSREELVMKLRELEDTVQCFICMERRRNVAFLCGHSACADCAENLSVCHMCRETITKKITLY